MTRKVTGFENGFMPENNISLIDCLKSYTINNAYATYNEKESGSLKVGKAADVVVLEQDLFELSGEEIKDVKVFETYFGGKKVYRNE